MNCFHLPLIAACMMGPGISAIDWASAESPEEPIRTAFAVLVGYPTKDQSTVSGAFLVPGTVIPLMEGSTAPSDIARRQIVEKSLAFSQAAEKLWATFRLDPARQLQDGKSELAEIGKPVDLPSLQDAKVKMTATLLRYDNSNATFRVVFRQGEKTLADSTVLVARGGRAVVGGMDGPAAPYIFVFVEPDAPAAGKAGSKTAALGQGIAQPKPVYTVQPKYPEEVKKEKIQGTVVLILTTDVEGAVIDVSVLEDPDPRLTKEAIEAVRQWKFQPALDVKGQPIKVQFSISVRFKLQ